MINILKKENLQMKNFISTKRKKYKDIINVI